MEKKYITLFFIYFVVENMFMNYVFISYHSVCLFSWFGEVFIHQKTVHKFLYALEVNMYLNSVSNYNSDFHNFISVTFQLMSAEVSLKLSWKSNESLH